MTLIVDVSCRGSDGTRRIELQDGEEVVVGRDNESVVLKKDQTLSRKHFALRYADGSIVVEHLSKTNPTLMAPDGSGDFERVDGIHREFKSCRIIAGAHRFIATIDSPASATISGEIGGDWSDVSNDESPESEGGFEIVDHPDGAQLPREEGPYFSFGDESADFSDAATVVDDEKNQKPDIADSPAPNPFAEPEETHAKRKPEELRTSPKVPEPVKAPEPEPEPQPDKEPDQSKSDAFTDDFFD